MAKVNFGVRQQIFTGFIVVIVLFTINAGFTIYFNKQNSRDAKFTTEVTNPSKEAIDRFKLMVLNSEKLITNWMYLFSNQEDKSELLNLHNQRFPALRSELDVLKKQWTNPEDVVFLDSILDQFALMLEDQKEIMDDLVSFEDYEDPFKKFTNQENLESKVLPKTKALRAELEILANKKNEEVLLSQQRQIQSFEVMDNLVWTLFAIVLFVGLSSALFTANRITRPLGKLQGVIVMLSKGELPESMNTSFRKDEIGLMGRAVTQLVNGIRATSRFAERIGEGDLEASFTPLSENDVLGNSLLIMRDNLKKVAQEDQRRNWANEGIAKFGELLRESSSSIKELAPKLVSELVAYTNSNQGALFVINSNDDGSNEHMYNAATYAWDREKFLETRIYPGDGLVGQAWQDKDLLHITEVPADYIHIGSGTGKANPRAILVVPLMVNEAVYGCLELASFHAYKVHEIDFIKRIGESIATTLSTAKVNEKTNVLLAESKELTEQMRAQEEEMRQNMEELMATQEEMERKSAEMEDLLAAAKERETTLRTEKQELEKRINETT